MSPEFSNVYDDDSRAEAYAALEFPGTYALAFRDLPRIIREERGAPDPAGRALDFGCGTGRSTRFLKGLGFDAVGVDISASMLARARERDPEGDYRLVGDDDSTGWPPGPFELILATFTFDNVPTRNRKVALLTALGRLLGPRGRLISVVSSPEIYVHEWASFSTKAFPGNRSARSGDRVRIVMLDVEDRRPVEDVLWTDEAYEQVYREAGLVAVRSLRPLATGREPTRWVSETTVAPWVVWVLAPGATRAT